MLCLILLRRLLHLLGIVKALDSASMHQDLALIKSFVFAHFPGNKCSHEFTIKAFACILVNFSGWKLRHFGVLIVGTERSPWRGSLVGIEVLRGNFGVSFFVGIAVFLGQGVVAKVARGGLVVLGGRVLYY